MTPIIEVDKKWLDKNGNLKPNSWQGDSENPSSINTFFFFLCEIAKVVAYHETETGAKVKFDIDVLNWRKHGTNGGVYMTNEFDAKKHKEVMRGANILQKIIMFFRLDLYKKIAEFFGLPRSNNRFSHDETNAVVTSSYYNNHEANIVKVKRYTMQTWYRFYDLGMVVGYAKNGGLIKRKIICYFAKKSFTSTKKDPSGKYLATGKMQAFMRLYGLGFSEELVECLAMMPEKEKIAEVASNWFPEKDHPCNQVARLII